MSVSDQSEGSFLSGTRKRSALIRAQGRAGPAWGGSWSDAADRGRVSHALADLAISAGDPLAAREALVVAAHCGEPLQRDHARSRLHTLSRDLGDQVGMRRWRSFTRPALVSLSLAGSRGGRAPAGSPPVELVRWRRRMEGEATS